MTEEEKKRKQQEDAAKRRQNQQAAAKARAQQQDAQAAEQAVANVEQEKPQEQVEVTNGVKSPSNTPVHLPGNAVKTMTLGEVKENALPAAEFKKQEDAYNKQEQEKADIEWDEGVKAAHENAGSKLVGVTVDPLFEGTSYAENVQKMADAGMLNTSVRNRVSQFASLKHEVDVAKVSSVRDLAYIASSWEDEKTAKEFIDEYAEHNKLNKQDLYWQVEQLSGGRVFAQPISARGRAENIGLYDDYGNSLSPSKATPDQFIRAINLTPDKEDQEELISCFKAMYPEYYSKDMEFAFIDSADLTQKDYNDRVDEMNASFTIGATQENSTAYLDEYEAIKAEYANPRIQAQMLRALTKSYETRTGIQAPTPEEADQALIDRANAANAPEGEEEKKSWWAAFKSKPEATSSYSALAQEEEVEEVEPQASGGYGGGGGYGGSASSYAAASGVSVPKENPSAQAAADASQMAAAQAQADENALVLTVGSKGVIKRPGEQTEAQTEAPVQMSAEQTLAQYGSSAAYNPNMTDAEALALYQRGEQLDARNYDQIKWFAEDADTRALMGNMSMYANLGTTDKGGRNVVEKSAHYGNRLGMAAMALGSGGLPDDISINAQLTLGSVMREVKDAVRTGAVTIPKGENQFDYVLSLPEYSHLAEQVDSVAGIQADVAAAYAQRAELEKEAYDNHLEDIKGKMIRGEGTPEMAQELAVAYGNEYADLGDDELRARYRFNMSERGTFFTNDGAFWQGNSAAAQEGMRLMRMGGGANGATFSTYKAELKDETLGLIDDYTTAAKQMGMTLEEYLGSAGIDSIDKVVEIAYNNMLSRGNAYAADADAQAAAEVVATSDKGVWDVTVMGAQHGVESMGANLAQTTYMVLDAADYSTACIDLENEYMSKYGPSLAAVMYRADLNAHIASGNMSQESAAELQRNMGEVRNIFDIGYELDPGFLEGLARDGYETLQKDVEGLEAEAAKLPSNLRTLFNTVSSGFNSLTGMAAATLLGGVTGSAAIGSALVWGGSEYSSAYDANRTKGMSRGMASLASLGNAAISAAVNMGGTGTDMDVWFKGSAYDDFYKALKGKNGIGVVKSIAELTTKYAIKRGVEEAGEEVGETVFGTLYDLTDNAMLAIGSGKPATPSMILRSIGDAVRETDFDALGKELLTSAGMGFVMGGIFSLGGSAKTSISALKGVNMQSQYASIDLATEMARGNVLFTEENIGKVYAAMQKDLLDARFRKYIDGKSIAATEQKAMLAAATMGAGHENRVLATNAAQKAQEYSAKAEAARSASNTAEGRFWELRDRLSGGDLSAEVELESARMQMQKAQQALQEAENASGKESEKAREAMTNWLRECRAQASQIKTWMLQEQADQIAQMRTMAAEELAKRYEAEEAEAEKRANITSGLVHEYSSNMQEQLELSGAAQGAIRSRGEAVAANDAGNARAEEIAELRASAAEDAAIDGEEADNSDINAMTDDEAEAEIARLDAQIGEAEGRVSEVTGQSEELGLDAETAQALSDQEVAPLKARKESIIARQTEKFDDLFGRMMQTIEMDNDEAYEQLSVEYEAFTQRLQRMGVDTDRLIARQYGVTDEDLAKAEADEKAAEQARAEEEEKNRFDGMTESLARRMQKTAADIEMIQPARMYFMNTPLYVNASQKEELLSADGVKTLSQFNHKYGTKLTDKAEAGAMPLDGNALSDVNAEAAGVVDAESAHPEEELLRIMQTGKKLVADQRAEKTEARELERKKKEADARRRRKVEELTGAEKKPERQARKINEVVAGENSTVEDIDRTINQIEGVSMSMNDGTDGEPAKTASNESPVLEATFEDPETQKLAEDLYNNWGIRLRLAELDPRDEGFYDRESNSIVLNKRLGTGEKNRTVVVHELIHFCENEPWYDAFKRDILGGAYSGETEIAENKQRLREMGYAESEIEYELVARAAKPLFNGDEVLVNTLINKGKTTPVKRAYAAITQFLARRKAKKNGELARYDQLASARKTLQNGLKNVTPTAGTTIRHSYAETALSQYENKTAQNIDYIFKGVKDNLKGTEHEVRTDRAAIADAVKRIDDEGSQTVLSNLMGLSPDRWNSDDHVTAQVLLLKANRENDVTTQAMLAMVYGRARSAAGLTLQKGKALGEVTAQDILEYGAKKNEDFNRKNGGTSQYAPVGNGRPLEKADNVTGDAAEIIDRAAAVNKAIMEVRNANDIDDRKNRWGVALPRWKMELIERYGLKNTKLPGVHYNQATKKQRQLCAILAADTEIAQDTDIKDNQNGHLGLIQQLEAIKKGKAVQTIADITYYTNKLAEAKALSNGAQDTYQDTDGAKIAFARAYDSVNNTVPVNFMSAQWRNAVAYMHMLSSSTTGVKNVLANVVMKPLDIASEAVATGIDKAVSSKTKNRTTTISTSAEFNKSMKEGLGEVLRTVADTYVYGVDTSHGRKYDAAGGNKRVFQNDLAEGKRRMVDFIMQLGDRPFFRSEYVRQYDQIKRLVDEGKMKKSDIVTLEDGRRVSSYVAMTDADIHQEAARRALESVFQDDSELLNWINSIPEKYRPFMQAVVPFVKTPTNVAKRMLDYSPVGLAKTIVMNGVLAGRNGNGFDQRKFVMGMGRGLTGTGLIFAGALLSSLGYIDIDDGYGDEEGALYSAGAADYKPYGVYINLGDNRVALDWLSVAGIWMTIGAEAAKELDIESVEDLDVSSVADALGTSMMKSVPGMLDLLFDNTMLSSVSDLLDGAEDGQSLGMNIVETVGGSMLQQYLSPGDIRQFAKFTDEFDRDYRHDNTFIEAINKQVLRNWPVFRQMLPIKYDMTGDPVRQVSKYGWGKEDENVLLNFMNYYMSPTNIQTTKGDAALNEVVDLAYRIGTTSHIPGSIAKTDGKVTLTKDMAKASGLDYDSGEHILTLSVEEQRRYNQMFSDICFNGTGDTSYKKIRGGSFGRTKGIRDLVDGYGYSRLSDASKEEAMKDIISVARNIVREQICIDRGYRR